MISGRSCGLARFYGTWGSAILAVLLMLAGGSWWLWDTTQQRNSDSIVDNLRTTAPVLVKSAIDNLRPYRLRTIQKLKETVANESAERQHQLHAACALAEFGEVPVDLLVDHIAFGLDGECPNIVRALRFAKDDALSQIAARLKEASVPAERVRFATVAMHLGDLAPACGILALQEDPEDRTTFIHTYYKWPGDFNELATILGNNITDAALGDLRSAVCAALGYVELGRWPRTSGGAGLGVA